MNRKNVFRHEKHKYAMYRAAIVIWVKKTKKNKRLYLRFEAVCSVYHPCGFPFVVVPCCDMWIVGF